MFENKLKYFPKIFQKNVRFFRNFQIFMFIFATRKKKNK